MQSRTVTIRQRFSRKASSYDDHASVQCAMADTLLRFTQERCPQASSDRLRILEIGCGTGRLTASLLHAFPAAHVTAIDIAPGMLRLASERLAAQADRVAFIQADIEQWVLERQAPAGEFDLIISNACFQWLSDPESTIRHLHLMTAPDGCLAFSTFGPRTFQELHRAFRMAYESAGWPPQRHGLLLQEAETWPVLLQSAGWRDPVIRQETVIERFPSVRAFLHSVQAIGASATQADQSAGPLPRRRLFAEMTAAYEREYASVTGIPATYELIYVCTQALGRNDSRSVNR